MLRDSIAVVCTRLRAIPLAMIIMRKSTFPFVSHEYGASLGGPSGRWSSAINGSLSGDHFFTWGYTSGYNSVENVHGRDLLLVMGDLNAKVGSDNLNFERVMGREGCGVQNDNGERLVEWCAFNNMIIGGTLFPHRNIHKLTWTSPNGRDQNQIDHLMVNSM